MDNLLRFRPEPFPELDAFASEAGFDSLPGWFGAEREDEWEDLEAELGRRRKPRRPQAASRPARVARALKPLARPIRQARLAQPMRPLRIPFIPLRVIPLVPPSPAADDSLRSDRAGSEGSGSPPVSPAAPEPASEYVFWVQECLNRTLGLRLPVDGIMGRQTRSALRAFQAQWGLPVSGLVGPDTEAALKSAAASVWRGEIGAQGSLRVRGIQHALNRILGLSLATDGVIGPQTRSAIRLFQQRAGLAVDGVAGPATLRALQEDLPRSGRPELRPPVEARSQAMDWTRVPGRTRMAYIMRRLIGHYGLSENGAAGLVGNLWGESACIPNRIEGSRPETPMTAMDFYDRISTFTAGEIAGRNAGKRLGPKLAGVGLAQWTEASRRSGLFQHEYAGRRLGPEILFDMDAQIDYLFAELRMSYAKVYKRLCDPAVTVDAASDEVMYRFESPAEVHGPKDPVTGRSSLLRRDDPRLELVFRRRRPFGRQALAAYRSTT